jgi:four helix bundle protein
MAYQKFKQLKVWQEVKRLAVEIYKMTSKGIFNMDYGLRDQIRRAAVSVASNIAEGYERNSSKEFERYLAFAKGSISELRTQLEIALDIGYIDKSNFERIDDNYEKVTAMTINLMKGRKKLNGDTVERSNG